MLLPCKHFPHTQASKLCKLSFFPKHVHCPNFKFFNINAIAVCVSLILSWVLNCASLEASSLARMTCELKTNPDSDIQFCILRIWQPKAEQANQTPVEIGMRSAGCLSHSRTTPNILYVPKGSTGLTLHSVRKFNDIIPSFHECCQLCFPRMTRVTVHAICYVCKVVFIEDWKVYILFYLFIGCFIRIY